jgi:hypothetical protein
MISYIFVSSKTSERSLRRIAYCKLTYTAPGSMAVSYSPPSTLLHRTPPDQQPKVNVRLDFSKEIATRLYELKISQFISTDSWKHAKSLLPKVDNLVIDHTISSKKYQEIIQNYADPEYLTFHNYLRLEYSRFPKLHTVEIFNPECLVILSEIPTDSTVIDQFIIRKIRNFDMDQLRVFMTNKWTIRRFDVILDLIILDRIFKI